MQRSHAMRLEDPLGANGIVHDVKEYTRDQSFMSNHSGGGGDIRRHRRPISERSTPNEGTTSHAGNALPPVGPPVG